MAFTHKEAKELTADVEMEVISGPIIIVCNPEQDWRVLFDRPFTYIDAEKMTYTELCGTDYSRRARLMGHTYHQPLWHKDMLKTKTLIIDNLAEIPPSSSTDLMAGEEGFGNERPGQIDYLFMCRDSHEGNIYRKVNGSGLFYVGKDVTTYIIQRSNNIYRVTEPIRSRADIRDIRELN